MKYSFLRIKFIPHRNDEGFSRQGRSISLSHKICQFYGSPKSEGVQRSGTPQRSEDNWKGALLLEKEIVR